MLCEWNLRLNKGIAALNHSERQSENNEFFFRALNRFVTSGFFKMLRLDFEGRRLESD
jgi:hypothetical protein